MADAKEQIDEKYSRNCVPEDDATLSCSFCHSSVREPAWLLACLHACCDRCLDIELAAATISMEADSSDDRRSFGECAPSSSWTTEKVGSSVVCPRCKEPSRVVTSASGEFLSIFSKALEEVASHASLHRESGLSGGAHPSQSSEVRVQVSQLFCLDCDAPCSSEEAGGEMHPCLAREHDVCPTRHPRVAKRLSQLQSDARQAGAALASERAELVAAQDGVALLDRKLSEMQEKHLDTLLDNKRILLGAVDAAYEQAADEVRATFGNIKVKAAQATSDAGRILARANHALHFSETLSSAALASPSAVAAHSELVKCVQQQLQPLTTECRRAKLALAAATLDPEQDIHLSCSKPTDLVQHLASFIGKPMLLAVEKEKRTPEVHPMTDVYQTQDVASLQDNSSFSNNEVSKAVTAVNKHVTNISSFRSLSQAESTGSSTNLKSRPKDEAALLDSRLENGSTVFRNSHQDMTFDQASVAGSHATWSSVVSGRSSRFGSSANNGQPLPMRVSSQEPLAVFQCPSKCWDIAIAEESDTVFIAAYEDGLRELDFNGEEISSWCPLSTDPVRSHESNTSYTSVPDGIYTVDTLCDGRLVIGLLRSSSIAVLRRVALMPSSPPGKHDQDQSSRGSAWAEDGARVQLGARPWRLSSNGDDLVAVIQSSYGAKTMPGATFVVVSLSRRALVGNHRLPFAIASVAVIEQRLFAASYGEVDDRQYQHCTVVELNHDGDMLWRVSYEDSLFDLACHPAGAVVYLALKYRRNVVAVGGSDGHEVAASLLPRHSCGPVRLSLRRGSKGRQKPIVMILLRYDLLSVEVYSMV